MTRRPRARRPPAIIVEDITPPSDPLCDRLAAAMAVLYRQDAKSAAQVVGLAETYASICTTHESTEAFRTRLSHFAHDRRSPAN